MTTFVYGNIPGLALSLIAIYNVIAWIEKKKVKYGIASIVAICFAIFIKSNYKIYLVRYGYSSNIRIDKKI